jgi:hypothetical protein
MRRTLARRGPRPRHPPVSAVVADERKSKSIEIEGLTGGEIAARSWATPSAMMGSARMATGDSPLCTRAPAAHG